MSFGPQSDFVFKYKIQIDSNGRTTVYQDKPDTKNMGIFMGKMWERIKGIE